MIARPGRRTAVAALLVLAVASGGCSDDGKSLDRSAGGDASDVATGGEVPTAGELAAAARRVADATSFRLEGTAQQRDGGSGQQLVQRVQMVFQAPDRLEVKLLDLQGSLQQQQWFVGDKAYVQEPPQPDGSRAPARCATTGEANTADPRRLLLEIAKVTKATPASTGAGAEFDLSADAAAIAFSPPQGATYTDVKGRATVVGGTLALLHVEAKLGTKTLKADFIYGDVGSAPPVEPPAADC